MTFNGDTPPPRACIINVMLLKPKEAGVLQHYVLLNQPLFLSIHLNN